MEPKKTNKTFQFSSAVAWEGAKRGTMTHPSHPAVEVGSPPDFRGEPDVWCPEELLTGSVNTCLMLTFLSYAQHRKLDVLGYESGAVGVLENTDGKYRVTEIAVHPLILLKSQADIPLAENILKDAKDGCFISNSVLAKVEISPEFKMSSNHPKLTALPLH